MAQILETMMLICFGLSWPISVVKNVKSGTARGMSLPFILMITCGYVAGITAKLLTENGIKCISEEDIVNGRYK